MSLEIKKSISAIGDSLAFAYGAFTGVKNSQPESTPPVGSRNQLRPQTANTGEVGTAGLVGLGAMPLIVLAAGIYFMSR